MDNERASFLVNEAFRIVYGVTPGANERKAFVQTPPIFHPRLSGEHLAAIRALRGGPQRGTKGMRALFDHSLDQYERD